eukprot:3344561-Alexandrium_andersonii.AAC.1
MGVRSGRSAQPPRLDKAAGRPPRLQREQGPGGGRMGASEQACPQPEPLWGRATSRRGQLGPAPACPLRRAGRQGSPSRR